MRPSLCYYCSLKTIKACLCWAVLYGTTWASTWLCIVYRLIEEGRQMGFPILVKAVMGGGGKGMKLAMSAADLTVSPTPILHSHL